MWAVQVINSDRSIVDDSFGVIVMVGVPDDQSLRDCLGLPIHKRAKREVLLLLIGKVVVVDFQSNSFLHWGCRMDWARIAYLS